MVNLLVRVLEASHFCEYTDFVNATLEHDLHEQLERLSPEAQRRVLEYARELEQQHSGDQLLSLAGSMSLEEATEMQQMLEREFGQVKTSDWSDIWQHENQLS